MSLFEAFAFFDSDRKGGLSGGKLWAGLDWLQVGGVGEKGRLLFFVPIFSS